MDKDQFLLRPNKNLIERLKTLAVKYKKGSGQQVAVEVIEQYLEFWEEAEEAKQAAIRRQRMTVKGKPKTDNDSTAKKKPAKKAAKHKGRS